MVVGTCPFCGTGYRLNISGSLPEWYAEHFPELAVGDRVTGPWVSCFKQVLRGERVLEDNRRLKSVWQKRLEESADGEGRSQHQRQTHSECPESDEKSVDR